MGADIKGKGKEREKAFEGMVWEVPGFHDEVFWDCECLSTGKRASPSMFGPGEYVTELFRVVMLDLTGVWSTI